MASTKTAAAAQTRARVEDSTYGSTSGSYHPFSRQINKKFVVTTRCKSCLLIFIYSPTTPLRTVEVEFELRSRCCSPPLSRSRPLSESLSLSLPPGATSSTLLTTSLFLLSSLRPISRCSSPVIVDSNFGFSVVTEDNDDDDEPSPLTLPEKDFLNSVVEPLRTGILPPEDEARAVRPI